jgi:hypothetical protein
MSKILYIAEPKHKGLVWGEGVPWLAPTIGKIENEYLYESLSLVIKPPYLLQA